MATSKKKNEYYYLSTLARGLNIIELLANEGFLSVSEVSKVLNINRTSSHRYLATLKQEGYVKQDDNSRYRLTFKIFELGMKVGNRFSIRQEALPWMQILASEFNETINFGYLDGSDIIHIEKVEGNEILKIDSVLGSRAPAHCTALGKAILAFLPENELEDYFESTQLIAQTPNSITDIEALKSELEIIQKDRIAYDREELAIGLRCVSAPILDGNNYPNFAISVSGVAMRMSDERIEKIKNRLCGISVELSSKVYTADTLNVY